MAHRIAAAAVTSAGVFAAVLVMAVLRSLSVALFGAVPPWELLAQTALVPALPAALGLFVFLAILLPVTAGLTVRSVLLRGAGALIPVGVLLFVAQWIANAGRIAEQVAPQTGGFTDVLPYPGDTTGMVVATSVQQALSGAITLAPLVLLAVVIQWAWLNERAKHAPGTADV